MRRCRLAPALALAVCLGLVSGAAQKAGAAAEQPALRWTLDFPQGAPTRVGETKPIQLRFHNALGAAATLPCAAPQSPGALVREVAGAVEGADGKEQWLILEPVWDAPQCSSGGTLTFAAGQRGQYRAQFAAPQSGAYLLRGLWPGVGNLGELQVERSLTLP